MKIIKEKGDKCHQSKFYNYKRLKEIKERTQNHTFSQKQFLFVT